MRASTVALTLLCAVPHLAQGVRPTSPLTPAQQLLAGTWIPDEPAKSTELFHFFGTDLPGDGRLILELKPGRLTVAIEMPDDEQDMIAHFLGRPYSVKTMFRITESPSGRSGGGGAGSPAIPEGLATWIGDELVIPNPAFGIQRWAFSFVDGHLKREAIRGQTPDRVNKVTELFSRVK
jgi:hypothetical protein